MAGTKKPGPNMDMISELAAVVKKESAARADTDERVVAEGAAPTPHVPADQPPAEEQVVVTQPAGAPKTKRERKTRQKIVRQREPEKVDREESSEEQLEMKTVRMSPALADETENAAWNAGLSFSEYVRQAIAEKNDQLRKLLNGEIPQRPKRPGQIKGLFKGNGSDTGD